MEFKFNFGGDGDLISVESGININEFTCSKHNLRKCRKHDHNCTGAESSDSKQFNEIVLGHSTKLYYLKPEVAEMNIQSLTNETSIPDSHSISSLLGSTDLESGEYEGGLKLWECTSDLLDYVHAGKVSVQKKRVLDLGCGAGVLGALACLLGAQDVFLQDYNWEVIDHFTIPSVRHTFSSMEDKSSIERCQFLSGDWTSVCEYFVNNSMEKFDVILSSETIYNVKYYDKLRVVLENHLCGDGVALFAAKTQYFGVGGGVCEFIKYLNGTGSFDVSSVERIDAHVPREIVQVKKRTS